MSIPNLVYKSLDVRYTVFSTIANFVSEMTLGHVVTVALGQVVTLLDASTVEQIVRILGVNRANYDTSTKVGMRHFYSYQIHSVRLVNRKSKMAAIFQDGHEQIHFTSSSQTKVAEFVKKNRN